MIEKLSFYLTTKRGFGAFKMFWKNSEKAIARSVATGGTGGGKPLKIFSPSCENVLGVV